MPLPPILQQSEKPQKQSAAAPTRDLDVGRANVALRRKHAETGYQIFKRDESHVFRNVVLPEQDANLDGRLKTQASLGLASKVVSSKWKNLSSDQRAAYETKAKEVNAANPLQSVSSLDSEEKLEMLRKALVQAGKIFAVMEVLGWSYIFVGVNIDTDATFKEVKGTPAMVIDTELTKSQMGLEDHLRSSRMLTKSFPSIAKSVGKNKSEQQKRMEHLALVSLNDCLAETGLKTVWTFPWIQVQSKLVSNRSFHFRNWPANIPVKRSMTIEDCKIVIRMFERGEIQGSLGIEQADETESRAPSFDVENQQMFGGVIGSEGDVGDFSFFDLLA
ncbi:hypothetical protein BJ741DRAFT_630721, partial [Chytriomyces cf. hyalinus JEL632]